MSRIRLLMSVEGQTEQAFVGAAIAPHLAGHGIDASARLLFTNRKLGGRGGVMRYSQVRRDLERLFKQHRGNDVRFTSMIDLYALPDDFPGFSAAQAIADPVARVQCLEASFAADLGDERFIPFIQLHEFEAVLFCDLTQLAQRIDRSEYGIRALQREVAGCSLSKSTMEKRPHRASELSTMCRSTSEASGDWEPLRPQRSDSRPSVEGARTSTNGSRNSNDCPEEAARDIEA